MNKEQIAEAKSRAQSVIDGFTGPKVQSARDVLRLIETIEVLKTRMLADNLIRAAGKKPHPLSDFFNSMGL